MSRFAAGTHASLPMPHASLPMPRTQHAAPGTKNSALIPRPSALLPRDELVIHLDLVHDFDRLAVDDHGAEAPLAHGVEGLVVEHGVGGVLDHGHVDHAAVLADGVAHDAG